MDLGDGAPPGDLSAASDDLAAAPDAAADLPAEPSIDGGWRSALYPIDWQPVHAGGAPDVEGRFLHDFGFAGYHRGDVAPPIGVGAAAQTISAADYGDGTLDARAAIQSAIDAVCGQGGGVVALSAGLFRVTFPASPATAPALRIACSGLVLRGAGSGATQLLLDGATVARQRVMILVSPTSYAWRAGSASRPEVLLASDALLPTRTLTLASVADFAVGDHVAVRTDLTDAFRAEHRMDQATSGLAGLWPASPATANGLTYLRTITAVDAIASTITLDAPTRYFLKARDNARVLRTEGYLTEIGLEGFAVGMREHATSDSGAPGLLGDSADSAYDTAGAAAYDVHAATAVQVEGARDGWIEDLATFLPAGNASGAHLLSIGLYLGQSSQRFTVRDCDLRSPQYRGGGGNGYLFLLYGMDHLLVDNHAVGGRHNFLASGMTASGDVVLRGRSEAARYPDDTHRFLSHALLFDSMQLDGAWLQSVNRGTDSTGAGFTSTQSVYWNTHVRTTHALTKKAPHSGGVAIETSQLGWGYVIGTSAEAGASAEVATAAYQNSSYAATDKGLPADHVEGVAIGATLVPASLYESQLVLRQLRGE